MLKGETLNHPKITHSDLPYCLEAWDNLYAGAGWAQGEVRRRKLDCNPSGGGPKSVYGVLDLTFSMTISEIPYHSR